MIITEMTQMIRSHSSNTKKLHLSIHRSFLETLLIESPTHFSAALVPEKYIFIFVLHVGILKESLEV